MSALPDDFRPPLPRERRRVRSADGTRIAVQVHGPTGAPTVVLAHGWTCSAGFWSRVVHRLDGRVRVVLYDQRGHGRSDAPGPRGYSVDALSEDLEAVLADTLAAGERTVHVGHSMGAMALMALAERRPALLRDRVAAAALLSTGCARLVGDATALPLPRPFRPLAAALTELALTQPRLLGVLPRQAARLVITHITMSWAASRDERVYCADLVRACPPATHAGFARMLAGLDLTAGVRALDVPTAVLCGTHDRLTPPGHSRWMAANLPHSLGVTTLDGIGHMTPLQSPDEVSALVLGLVRDHLDVAVDVAVDAASAVAS